jgi:site-specific DNA recombinase
MRYAIYTRQSAEKLDDLTSCQVQFQTCKDFAETERASNACWIGEPFDDQGYSGMTLDRPGMTRLRELVQARRIDVVYAVALDRLSRRMRDTVMLLDESDMAGVKLRLVYQSELTSNAEGRFLRHVLAAFAEFERDMIAARIADSRAYLKRHGRRLAGKVPYGYDARASSTPCAR